jgi:hypothetical protein
VRQQRRAEPYQNAFESKYDSKEHPGALPFGRRDRIIDAQDVS